MKQAVIQPLNQSIHVQKDNGTSVNYHIFNEYEIHINQIQPQSIQEWHCHQHIEEVILVNEGVLTFYEYREHQKIKTLLYAGDVVSVKQSIHTFANETNQIVKMTVFRLVCDGHDKTELIKNDKQIIDMEEL